MSKLAIYFPGIGYHCDKPLLYYSRSLARELGYQDDIQLRNDQYCNYLRALGALGLQDKEKAGLLLEEILKKQPDYLEALLLMNRL